MKKLFTVIISLLLPSLALLSQDMKTGEITDGREYWFGLPYCKISVQNPEPIRGEFPIAVWISSKVKTTAKISELETGWSKTVSIEPHKVTQVPMPDALMNRESEVVKNYGIHVESEDPITVAVYLSYRWSGEAFRVIPVEWLGKRYFSLNLYQDETDEIKPPQILIIATQDNTSVTYFPKTSTEKVEKGASKRVTLNKGQTYLILGKPKPGLSQDWSTDLTGTEIIANKPIAVISGHTKGAFPRYFIGMRSGWQEPWANFSRNMLCEMLWPVELWGNTYISAPIKYVNRPRGKTIVQDDFGDLIRIVASQDGTEIMQMRQDGSGFMRIGPKLNKGDRHDIINMEVPALYKSNYPIIIGQYGKTWWDDNGMMGSIDKDGDKPQNPWKSGQGMMLILAPIERWCSYAAFKSPEAIDNFIYITFEEKYKDKIFFDGKSITSIWGTKMQKIQGTDYVYITEMVPAGDHHFEAIDSAKFAAYAYGNWDRTKDGFAYGYPVGINYSTPCEDSLYVIDNMYCGDVEGQAFAIPDTAECAGIFSVVFKASESDNYNFKKDQNFTSGDKTVSYTLKVIDVTKPAKGVVLVLTRSGKSITKVYEYIPEEIAANPTYINFGMLKLNQKVCKTFTISNPGKVPMTVLELKLKSGVKDFEIDSKDIPLTLQPGESKEITVCATALSMYNKPVKDSIIAVLTCFPKTIVGLEFTTGEPIVWIDDARWAPTPVGKEVPKLVQIISKGSSKVELNEITWEDKTHFTRVENLDFPLTLEPGQVHYFTVYYKPDKPGVTDSTRAIFKGNTEIEKLYSDWVGIGIEAGPLIVGYDWQRRRIIDQYAGVTEYPWHINVDNSGNTDLKVKDIVIEDDPDKVFRINPAQIPATLSPNSPVQIDAFFAPKEEKSYTSKVKIIADFDGVEKIAYDYLKGIGTLPHIKVVGKEFLPPIKIGESLNDKGEVQHITINPETAMDLTLFDLQIEGPDKDAFEIDPDFYNNTIKDKNTIIKVNGYLDVPIKFTAKKAGKHIAELVAFSDAPDYAKDFLYGYGYNQGIVTSDYDYGSIFITLSKDGKVFLTNTGSVDIQITRDIPASLSGDVSNFNINSWYTATSGLVNPVAPFKLASGDTLWVDVKFTPTEVKQYNMQINYQTDIGDAVSYLTGRGMILKTIVKIPKGVYKVEPGFPRTIEVMVDKHPDETKLLEEANINSITVEVTFKSQGRKNIQDVYPHVSSCVDIDTKGTMLEGWTCQDVKILDGLILSVTFSGNTPLTLGNSNSRVLFRFLMNTFLSDLDIIPLPVKMNVNNRPYVVVEDYPGDIEILPVCVNTIRLIEIAGNRYSLTQNQPNPVSDNTRFEYSVALEGITNISLFNSIGEKVTTLVNEYQKPGRYEVKLNVSTLGLPSGIYHYKLISGPYIESREMIIIK